MPVAACGVSAIVSMAVTSPERFNLGVYRPSFIPASGVILSPASRPFSKQISSASERIGLQCRERRVILEQNGLEIEPGEGHMENVE